MDSDLQTEQAHKVANAVVFGQLESLIKDNPAIDLSSILNQQVSSYPQLVSSLAKTTLPSSAGQRRLGNVDLAAEAVSKQDRLPRISNETPIKVVEAFNNLIQEGQILHQLHGTYVIGVGLHYAVKTDISGDLDQITNLQYIHDKLPDIPAPRCLGTITDSQRIYFFMSRSPGSTLESVWPNLSVSTKVSIRNQLNSIFHHIRSLWFESQAERALIGGFVSSVSKDIRRTERIASNPVRSEKEFNEFLCSKPGRTTTTFIKGVCSAMSHNHRIDGNGRMLEDTVRVSSILDWETAGWYPEHWEFVKAMHAVDSRGPLRDWIDYLPTEAIGSYMVEYAVDCLIDRWHG
ncbi:hypothetical protein F5Y14DRAFT_443106 [Nemania sp. NC0429]|nr:hypothetical protein F5Y14DRAFT_443106 [Nemania sp. NC0429]